MAKIPGPMLMLGGLAAVLLFKAKDKPATEVVLGDGTATGDANSEVGGGPAGGGGSTGGGGSSITPPPYSGNDPLGYNSLLFADPLSVRIGLRSIGYGVALNNSPVGSKDVPNAHAQAFQAHFNQASAGGFHGAKGQLKMDGWMGKNSLNALELILQYKKDGGQDNWGAVNP